MVELESLSGRLFLVGLECPLRHCVYDVTNASDIWNHRLRISLSLHSPTVAVETTQRFGDVRTLVGSTVKAPQQFGVDAIWANSLGKLLPDGLMPLVLIRVTTNHRDIYRKVFPKYWASLQYKLREPVDTIYG